MSHDTLLKRDEVALVLIDVQEKLMPVISNGDEIIRKCKILLDAAKILNIPVIYTEQYPKGLGSTVNVLADSLAEVNARKLEKTSFSAVLKDEFLDLLDRTSCDQVLLCGVESHICVLQTALDLLDHDWNVHIASDACGSRNPQDAQAAVYRLGTAGVIINRVESALFEILSDAAAAEFKAISKLVK